MSVLSVFIDESGDSGFKTEKGSSEAFVISLIIFDEELEAEKTAVQIKEFKKSINKTLNYEIKFNKLKRSDKCCDKGLSSLGSRNLSAKK